MLLEKNPEQNKYFVSDKQFTYSKISDFYEKKLPSENINFYFVSTFINQTWKELLNISIVIVKEKTIEKPLWAFARIIVLDP